LGLGQRICIAINAWRQTVELSVLILAQAVAEVESRFLLVLIVLSLLPVASYSLEKSTGVPSIMILIVTGISAAIVSIYTTPRLNQMQALSKKLEVECEALYVKNLQTDMSMLFGDWGRDDIAQPHITSLREHFIEARKHLDHCDKHLCLPLREFLEEQPGSISPQDLRPVLMTLPVAQEAVVREGEPSRILDLLYCDVIFDDWEKMLSAWCFLKTRAEDDELREIKIVRTRDSFASARTGIRCAEMVVQINHYFATIRFLEASLTKLETQVDDVHHLAEQVGLVAGSLPVDPLLSSGQPARQSRLVVVAVALLRFSSLLAAAYLAGQYFVRYSPPSIRSNFPWVIQGAFALKPMVEPRDGILQEEESPLLPMTFCLPYVALMIVLLSDLRRCGSTKIKLKPLKPTQLLYEKYFGIEGSLCDFKVAVLQLFTVMLQALGKLQIMGGIVSFAIYSAPKHSDAFKRCFWAFVAFLCLNSTYPSVLLAFPSVKWVRRGAAMMDAALDMAYTCTYLIITVLPIYLVKLELRGNFGYETSDTEVLNFKAPFDAAFAFPSDFLGFFAVYYSLAHVCTVCRALERSDRVKYSKKLQSLDSSASRSLLSPSRYSCSKRYIVWCKLLPLVISCLHLFRLMFFERFPRLGRFPVAIAVLFSRGILRKTCRCAFFQHFCLLALLFSVPKDVLPQHWYAGGMLEVQTVWELAVGSHFLSQGAHGGFCLCNAVTPFFVQRPNMQPLLKHSPSDSLLHLQCCPSLRLMQSHAHRSMHIQYTKKFHSFKVSSRLQCAAGFQNFSIPRFQDPGFSASSCGEFRMFRPQVLYVLSRSRSMDAIIFNALGFCLVTE
jgi:hypothetical protein